MSNLRKIVSEQQSATPSTRIDDLTPSQQEISLNNVVGGSNRTTCGPLVIKGGCGDGTVDDVNKTCDE